MYAYELMRLAAENPEKYRGKTYKVKSHSSCVNGKGDFVTEIEIGHDGDIGDLHSSYRAFVNTWAELEEIPQEVDFITAVKAYHEGNKIYCIFEDVKLEHKPDQNNKCFGDGWGYTLKESSNLIINAKWYIG